jgi:G:T-mismatch repair DNA endonuclease (very short patch repair protein)
MPIIPVYFYIKGKYIERRSINLREEILELITHSPKHYTRIIKANQELLDWIDANHLLLPDSSLVAKIRSALYQETNRCSQGKTKQIKRFNQGFRGCGPASLCECTREKIINSVTYTKTQVSAAAQVDINKKRKETMQEKYGVEYNSQRADIKHIWTTPKLSFIQHDLLADYNWLHQQYNVLKRSGVDIAAELGVYYGTVLDYCRRHGFDIRSGAAYSLVEREIEQFISQQGIAVQTNNRCVLEGKELDLFVESKNFAIEVNGLYWHSYNPAQGTVENRSKHFTKSQLCSRVGVKLLHITDREWKTKNTAVKNIILARLGLNQAIMARKTKVVSVSKKEEKQFLNSHHLQGHAGSSNCIGLTYNGELVALASFKKPRFRDDYDIELLRLCFKSGISVSGGISKLMNASGYNCILSYSKNDLGFSDSFASAGFRKISDGAPGYFWTDGTNVISRFQSQKSKLPQLLGAQFKQEASEAENMFAAGYRRFWDCGNSTWVWNRK